MFDIRCATIPIAQVSATDELSDSLIKFNEAFLRVFMAAEAVELVDGKHISLRQSWPDCETARGRYEAFVHKFGKLFRDYEHACQGGRETIVCSFMTEQFADLYSSITSYIGNICQRAEHVYTKFQEDVSSKSEAGLSVERTDLREAIAQGMQAGSPLIRAMLVPEKAESSQDGRFVGEEPGPEPLAVVCGVLHEYLRLLEGIENYSVHLRRKGENCIVDYPDEGLPWFGLQLDWGTSAFFCPVPSIRRWRLRREIVLLKSFWDISLASRGRRLWEMITANWPETSVEANADPAR